MSEIPSVVARGPDREEGRGTATADSVWYEKDWKAQDRKYYIFNRLLEFSLRYFNLLLEMNSKFDTFRYLLQANYPNKIY